MHKGISAQTRVNHKGHRDKNATLISIPQLEKEYQHGDMGLTDMNLCWISARLILVINTESAFVLKPKLQSISWIFIKIQAYYKY